jgi:tRNA nucleotidyltransferase (CCA-adding enzyme)
VLDLLLAADALRRPERLDALLRACSADALSRPGRRGESYAPAERLRAALTVVRDVDAGAIAAAHPDSPELPQRIKTARLKALQAWEKANDGNARQASEPPR